MSRVGVRTHSICGAALAAMFLVPAALAEEPAADPFEQGSWIFGLRIGGGIQNHLPPGHDFYTGLEYLSWQPYLSTFPWDPRGEDRWRGMAELGVELLFQRYEAPSDLRGRTAYGAKGILRYHFVGLGKVVPYLEATAGAAATDLRVREIDSSYTFILEAGTGVSLPVSGRLALSLGYRFQHLSNAGFRRPNRGINADSLLLGVAVDLH